MVTKEQAMNAGYRQNFWFKSRDGKIKKVYVSGQCKTWKTRPNEFRLPVKFGLYESSAITEYNCQYFANSEDAAKDLVNIHS